MVKFTEKKIDDLLMSSIFSEGGTILFDDIKKYEWYFCIHKCNKNVIEKIPELIKQSNRLIWYKHDNGLIRLYCVDDKLLKLENLELYKRFKQIEKNIIKNMEVTK